jgi:integrase
MNTAKPTTLLDLAELYIQTHSLVGESANLYRRYARLATERIGCQDFAQITELDLHCLAAHLQETYSPTTAADILRRLRTLLQFAWSMRLVEDLPRKWPKIRSPRTATVAWTPQQIARLYRAATRQPGWIGSVKARDWWRAWLNAAWECGLRTSQMFRLRWRHIDWKHGLVLIEAAAHTKSYEDRWQPVSEDCLAALKAIRPAKPDPDASIFWWPDWPKSRRDFFSVFRYLCCLARVPAPRSHCQLTYRWRRSGITLAALESLEAARRHAGHTRPETTLRHYVDPRLLAKQPPAVPPLDRIAQDNGHGPNGHNGNGNSKAKQLWLLR